MGRARTRDVAERLREVVDVVDYGELAILPGVVDTHVHLNEPGRTEWEGFAIATTAAAIGGVTTLVALPLSSIPPTTTREAFAAKRAAAKGQCAVDVGFWGGVVPGNQGELAGLVEDGVRGFECFLVDSGVAESGCVNAAELAAAMQVLAGLGRPLLVHAELAGLIDLVIQLCRATGVHTQIVHDSAATAPPLLRAARAEGLQLTTATSPFECAPLIRDAANREALWAALAEGEIDFVASGNAGLQLVLPIVWTEAHARGHGLDQIAMWMCVAEGGKALALDRGELL